MFQKRLQKRLGMYTHTIGTRYSVQLSTYLTGIHKYSVRTYIGTTLPFIRYLIDDNLPRPKGNIPEESLPIKRRINKKPG